MQGENIVTMFSGLLIMQQKIDRGCKDRGCIFGFWRILELTGGRAWPEPAGRCSTPSQGTPMATAWVCLEETEAEEWEANEILSVKYMSKEKSFFLLLAYTVRLMVFGWCLQISICLFLCFVILSHFLLTALAQVIDKCYYNFHHWSILHEEVQNLVTQT